MVVSLTYVHDVADFISNWIDHNVYMPVYSILKNINRIVERNAEFTHIIAHNLELELEK